MKRAFGLLFPFVLVCLITSPSLAGFVPPNLPPGSQYQLVLITAAQHDAFSADISLYNDFVNAQAALNPELPATTWRAVVSTDSVDAKSNAPSGGLPVYNTQGIQIAAAETGFYTATLLNPVAFDLFGNPNNVSTYVWTGSLSTGDGYKPPLAGYNFTLGNSETVAADFPLATVGEIHSLNWAGGGLYGLEIHAFLYALSDPITVPVPEPSSLCLAVMGVVALAYQLLQRFRVFVS